MGHSPRVHRRNSLSRGVSAWLGRAAVSPANTSEDIVLIRGRGARFLGVARKVHVSLRRAQPRLASANLSSASSMLCDLGHAA